MSCDRRDDPRREYDPRFLPEPPEMPEMKPKPLLKKKCLVLDLDHTLVSTHEAGRRKLPKYADFRIPVRYCKYCRVYYILTNNISLPARWRDRRMQATRYGVRTIELSSTLSYTRCASTGVNEFLRRVDEYYEVYHIVLPRRIVFYPSSSSSSFSHGYYYLAL